MIRVRVKIHRPGYGSDEEWGRRISEFPATMLRKGSMNVRKLLLDHWIAKDAAEPNRLNPARRTHFWRTVAESIGSVRSDKALGRVTLTFHDGRLGHKVTGGTITAKKAKMLTIPIHAAAYAVRASFLALAEGVKLFVMRSKRGNLFLAGKKGKELVRYYLLKYSVTQGPWPKTLPTSQEVKAAFIRGATEAKR